MKEKARLLLKKFGYELKEIDHRPSIEFAKRYFDDRIDGIVACEIGVFRGINAERILNNLNVKEFHAVDPYEETIDHINRYTMDKVKHAYLEAHNRLVNDNVVWHKKRSALFFHENKKAFDFIYIDGQHTTEAVYLDLVNANEAVIKGIIAGHDIFLEDVMRAVIMFKDKNPHLKLYIDFPDFWFVKK